MESTFTFKAEIIITVLAVLLIKSVSASINISAEQYLDLFNIIFLLGCFFSICRLKQRLKNAKQSNIVLSKSNGEKDLLLQEIHHRVKNNLQVISSLLSLQSKYIKDEKALMALNEGQNRVESMMLIHQDLYGEDHTSGVSMRKYISLLADKIFDSYNISGEHIRIEYEIDDISLEEETVIPIGLVLNELISNALKHAFPENSCGIITVRLQKRTKGPSLFIYDNGIGMKSTIHRAGFGTKLIQSFARKLEGELTIESDQGTATEILIRNYNRA